MEYNTENDNELLFLVNEKDEEAEKLLIEKYKPITFSIAKNYLPTAMTVGLDEKDLFQEGLLGLVNAIETFSPEKNVTFYTYAAVCIEYNIRSCIRKASRKKNITLNTALSLDFFSDDENENKGLYSIVKDESENPEKKIVIKEEELNLINKIKSKLTSFEKEVFDLKLNGNSNEEIAQLLLKDKTSIENTITRIKLKYKKIIKNKKDLIY